jgi:type I restriction enzyme S subunit
MQMIEFTVVDHQRHWISQYSKIQLRLPLPEEQSAIAAVLSDMDAETEVLTAKLNKAKFIKQGMMQELLTGRIRLVKPETTAIPVTKVVEKNRHGYSEGYKDAVILVALVNSFGTEQHPFTAFDCQKFPYLFHRYIEGVTKGYKKFAAGPYNPSLKYRTARPIALGKKYIREHTSLYKGFVTDENAEEALGYFEKWYSEEPIKWLEQFRYIKNRKNELELLTTVDMAVVELRAGKKPVIMSAVKEIIKNSAEWKAKLKREIFSDENITRAIAWSIELFGDEE